MLNGSSIRKGAHPIDRQFLDRWSPRAMSGEPVSREELLSLFEAARWAPSSGNQQPWRMLFARRETPQWDTFFGLLAAGNQAWCERAAALVVFVSRTLNSYTGRTSVTHSYDTGAAWGYFALQGYLKGYVVHGMEGFDYARARQALAIPEEFRIEAMAAVGHPAPLEVLSAQLQAREAPNDRRSLEQTVCEGAWALPD